jgi:hypothetical protein
MRRVTSLDSILDGLAGLDDWLIALGIPPKLDRWHETIRIVERAKASRESVERGGQRQTIDNYISGLFDASEMHEIIRAFSGGTSGALKDKMMRALSGPIASLQEQPKNGVARNAMFELSLAADWKNRGASVQLGEPDILLHLGNALFQVECKRPFYERSVLSNIKDAASQLGKELDKEGNENAFGIVAISLSRIFTPGDRVRIAPVGEGRRVMKEQLAELIRTHSHDWRVRGFLGFHQRIVAVMFHLSAPWDEEGIRLINVAAMNFVQAGRSAEGWEALTKNMAELH